LILFRTYAVELTWNEKNHVTNRDEKKQSI